VEGTISSSDHSAFSVSDIQDLKGVYSCAYEDDHAPPLHNMLSSSYHFHPVHNGRLPNQEDISHQDIRRIQCSDSDKLEIANVCRLPQDTILHQGDIYYGDVTVRDVIYLAEPAEITTNLLHYLLRSQFPADHATVTLVGHELTNGILFCNWDTMYYDESWY
jgi:transcriptional antiterminator Rof (Rho-off)